MRRILPGTVLFSLVLISLLAAPLGAQKTARVRSAGVVAAPVAATHIPQGILTNLETTFNQQLMAMDPMDPVDMLGGTRALYLSGYGAVFSSEINLIVTPGNFPIAGTRFTPEFKAAVRQRKIAHLPKVQDLLKTMVKMAGYSLVPMPDDQKIVFAIRLRYLPEEDRPACRRRLWRPPPKKTPRPAISRRKSNSGRDDSSSSRRRLPGFRLPGSRLAGSPHPLHAARRDPDRA
jgi:hypothetical protein